MAVIAFGCHSDASRHHFEFSWTWLATRMLMCTHRRSAGLYLHSCRALLCSIRYSGHHSLAGQVQKLQSYIQGSCSWGQMGEAKREEAEDLSLVVLAFPFSLWAE